MIAGSLEKVKRGALRRTEEYLGGFRRKFYGPITHVKTDIKAAALTFDDGPHPKHTLETLDVLGRFGAKATFFMVGKTARCYPELIKLVAQKGHAIGNHSLTHTPFPCLDSAARRAELEGCSRILDPYSVKLFRPPFGLENTFSHRDALGLGYRVVKWSVSVDDWREHPPKWIAERVIKQLKPGSIILLHENRADNPQHGAHHTIAALEILFAFTCKEFTYCTLPELFELGRPATSFRSIW